MRHHPRPRARFWTAEAREALAVIAAVCALGAVAVLALSH